MSRASVYDVPELPFSLFDTTTKTTDVPTGVATGLVRSTHVQESDVSRAFFSTKNMDVLQKELRDSILEQTGYLIDRQSDESLLIIMRYVYMQSGRNCGGSAEVRRLNRLVLREIVPQVASGLMQYLAYLKDASTMAMPLPRGQATSLKGTKTTELFRGL